MKEEVLGSSFSIWSQLANSSPVILGVLLVLISLSVITWGIAIAKVFYLRRVHKLSQVFVERFWNSASLKELNIKIDSYKNCPTKIIFQSCYKELTNLNHLRSKNSDIALQVTIDNLTRSLQKAKQIERSNLETYLSFLAISASASPFIGLFGTVFGIIKSFGDIARTGSTSLVAVAPGMSEALVATAFGLAAAIPASIGYNMAASKIRKIMITVDGFNVDFLNLVERHLVTESTKEKPKAQQEQQQTGI